MGFDTGNDQGNALIGTGALMQKNEGDMAKLTFACYRTSGTSSSPINTDSNKSNTLITIESATKTYANDLLTLDPGNPLNNVAVGDVVRDFGTGAVVDTAGQYLGLGSDYYTLNTWLYGYVRTDANGIITELIKF